MEQYRITSVLVVDAEGVLCGAINSNDLMRAKVIDAGSPSSASPPSCCSPRKASRSPSSMSTA
jgi:hypothetical protein